jgi:L-2-hydroxyglutarate oxidase LhgO
MTDQLDCVVIGAGVVGLAIGRALANAGRDVVVLEEEPEIGMHTSSRNSEVIHAGIYYEQNSLKATLCVQGKELLYDYCESRRVPFQRIGKLIVASEESEKERLLGIRAKAENNGVTDLRLIERNEIRQIEPAVAGELALFSPSTGIIDSHSLMVSLRADIESHDGVVLTHSKLERVEVLSDGFRLHVADIDEAIECRTLINSAGLSAERVAKSIEGLRPGNVRAVRYAIGHYFSYQGKSPFTHLVYPLPIDGGLGIHATNDMGGAARFGPDVEWVDEINYDFDESRRQEFADAIRQYFPGLDIERLTPGYTGIRPKLTGPGEKPGDFAIEGPETHGIDGLVNLFGIESPGLTACLAIGDYVAREHCPRMGGGSSK